jgi:hypothetical protein
LDLHDASLDVVVEAISGTAAVMERASSLEGGEPYMLLCALSVENAAHASFSAAA